MSTHRNESKITLKIKAMSALVRAPYSILTGSAVLVAGVLANDLGLNILEYFYGLLIVTFVSMGAYAINDYFDYENDIRNLRHHKPLVSQTLKSKTALLIGIITNLLASLLAFQFDLWITIGIWLHIVLFFLYNLYLKRFFIVKNVIIAYAYFAIVVFGGILYEPFLEPLIIYFGIMGFIIGFAIEILLDTGDLEGDRYYQIQSLAVKYGKRSAIRIAVILISLVMILDPLPFFILIDSAYYLDFVFLLLITPIVLSYGLLSYFLLREEYMQNIERIKVWLVLIMFGGTVSYLIGFIF